MIETLRNWFIEPFEKGESITIIVLLTFIILFIGIIIKAIKPFFNPTRVKIEFNRKQSFISKISSHLHTINDRCCIGFHSLKVTGLKKSSTSINDVKIFIKSKDNWIQGINFKIKTKLMEDKNGSSVPAIVVGNDKDPIVLMKWIELSEIYKEKIEYGEVLLGSASYYFYLLNEEVLQASQIKFILTDNFKRKYICEYKMRFIDMFEQSISVLDYDVNLNQ